LGGLETAVIRAKTLVVVLVPWLASLGCTAGRYVLPTADGGPAPSPPSVEGRIARVEPGQIIVSWTSALTQTAVETAVRLTEATEIFTVYGGSVRESELLPGTKVRVWCPTRTKPKPDEAITARSVVIASTDPSDDWP
jgi:hypothetical protein